MTLYDKIYKARKRSGGKKVPVSCLTNGKGEAYAGQALRPDERLIFVYFGEQKKSLRIYNEHGQNVFGDYSLALGHHDGPEETAQAIKDQNFDVE